MDVRVLKYFLTVASVGNITKAAAVLHVTQPTLSRQMMDLEKELGTELLIRGKRHVILTDSGVLFQQRAQEIVALIEKTQRDLVEYNNSVEGMISIGCVETVASQLLPEAIETFHARYPLVQYEIYSANGDDIRNKIDNGHIDIGIMVEPIETAKYDFVRLNIFDRWGVLMRKDDSLAKEKSIRAKDIVDLPLFLSRRRVVTDEIERWLGEEINNLHVIGYHNLITNIMQLIKRGLGYSISVQGAHTIRPDEEICFVPFSPERKAGHVLAWRKNQIFNQATSLFLEYAKATFQME